MDIDNKVGIDFGGGGSDGWRRAQGKNWDNCNITIKYLIKNLIVYCVRIVYKI